MEPSSLAEKTALRRAGRENGDVARLLDTVADCLEAQRANPSLSRAYRQAARSIENMHESVYSLLSREGRPGLDRLPYTGPHIAAIIDEYLHTGRLRLLDRLAGHLAAEKLLQTVRGVGPRLAEAIHEDLGIVTLEELEMAAHDGRLGMLQRFGPRRIENLRNELTSMLATKRWHRPAVGASRASRAEASVELLLSIDTEYRLKAEAGTLSMIAPRDFNVDGEAWLPIWHLSRDGWDCIAMFSNTARAHRLEKTFDWVVIFFERDGAERQCTVVTEHQPPLSGFRVIRGREDECAAYFANRPKAAA